jgi:hypothetical protein
MGRFSVGLLPEWLPMMRSSLTITNCAIPQRRAQLCAVFSPASARCGEWVNGSCPSHSRCGRRRGSRGRCSSWEAAPPRPPCDRLGGPRAASSGTTDASPPARFTQQALLASAATRCVSLHSTDANERRFESEVAACDAPPPRRRIGGPEACSRFSLGSAHAPHPIIAVLSASGR